MRRPSSRRRPGRRARARHDRGRGNQGHRHRHDRTYQDPPVRAAQASQHRHRAEAQRAAQRFEEGLIQGSIDDRGRQENFSPAAAVALVASDAACVAPDIWHLRRMNPSPRRRRSKNRTPNRPNWSPMTAGDAERGAPAPSPKPRLAGDREHPAPIADVGGSRTQHPRARHRRAVPHRWQRRPPRLTFGHSTISRERSREPRSSTGKADRIDVAERRSRPILRNGAPSAQRQRLQKADKAPAIVPENSPFAGMNFANQKGPTNIKSDSLNLDYQKQSHPVHRPCACGAGRTAT